ncbi:MAG: transposase [Actinomycetota bacterium]|nr:transposase [Actinomycetota bacterium]
MTLEARRPGNTGTTTVLRRPATGIAKTRPRPAAPPAARRIEDILPELHASLFSLFKRKDQRQRAEQYLSCLLNTDGRKSIRNMAAHLGGPSVEQRLHHFISSSTWDWRPMRASLASVVEQANPTQAWVVRSMPIPKAGEHSVGVDSGFDLRRGHFFRGQQAFGVWAASDRLSVPINWRLYLPDAWLEDDVLRDRGSVPDDAVGETLDECAVAVALDTVRRCGSTDRPVLLAGRASATRTAMARFASAGVPVIARISSSYPMVVADPGMPNHGKGVLSAAQILESAKGSRRLVPGLAATSPGQPRSAFAAAVSVTFPGPRAESRPPMLLFGEWHDPRRPPARLWLTDLADAPISRLLRLTTLAQRVDRDFDQIGEQVGLRDYVGRSFRGWHRHVTIASAAHAAYGLSRLPASR